MRIEAKKHLKIAAILLANNNIICNVVIIFMIIMVTVCCRSCLLKVSVPYGQTASTNDAYAN